MRWLSLALLVGCSSQDATPLGVTLQDGQVLVGAITTETLHLESGVGPIGIPLEDVGVVMPVEGQRIADANGHVTVWLRNGSELRGKWLEPELALALSIGGGVTHVDLPADDIQAMQTRGVERWSSEDVFRVRTVFSDDFLVDAERSRIPIENALGVFAPFLSECRSARPVGEASGPWRLELLDGTVLVGELSVDELEFALPMGPERVSVPLARLTSMERERWTPSGLFPTPAEAAPAEGEKMAPRPALSSSDGWFDHRALSRAKN